MQISVGVCLYLLKPSPHGLKRPGKCLCLLKEIIPRFGIPVSIVLNNGPAFVDDMVQLMAKGLRITWKLHIAYHS
jgi:hypothetical protein